MSDPSGSDPVDGIFLCWLAYPRIHYIAQVSLALEILLLQALSSGFTNYALPRPALTSEFCPNG